MNDWSRKPSGEPSAELSKAQLSLFADFANAGASEPRSGAPADRSAVQPRSRRVVINPHLLAARKIARKMRRLPDRSDAETRAGLAICAQLKAFLAEGQEATSPDQTSRH